MAQSLTDPAILEAALVGLELQKAEIDGKMAEIRQRLGDKRNDASAAAATESVVRRRKPMSAAARKRIGAATRKRWAALRKAKGK
jgi:hypothetical protein